MRLDLSDIKQLFSRIRSTFSAYPVHPFFFALIPILIYGYDSRYCVSPSAIFVIAGIFVIFTAALCLVLNAIIRSAKQTALAISIFLIWFFSWRVFSDTVGSLMLFEKSNAQAPICLYVLILAAFLIIFLRIFDNVEWFTPRFNLIGLMLFLFNIQALTVSEISMQKQLRHFMSLQKQHDRPLNPDKHVANDIYYIILDAYGRHDTLDGDYHYDNSRFLQALQERGFYIAEKSFSNYADTSLSLPSSLNFTYLDFGDGKEQITKKRARLFRELSAMIADNRVCRLLKRQGYTIVNVPTGFDFTENMPIANINITRPLGTWFDLSFLDISTVLKALEPESGLLGRLAQYKRRTFFDNIESIAQIAGPKFVFAHIMLPHPPFVFDRDGKLPPGGLELYQWEKTNRYIEQAQYTESETVKAVDTIVKRCPDAVIIIQGDHGPQCHIVERQKPTLPNLKERMRILNAYRVPKAVRDRLYSSVTPVNSFRILFDQMFGYNIERLPDRSLYSTFLTPCRLMDVTKVVE